MSVTSRVPLVEVSFSDERIIPTLPHINNPGRPVSLEIPLELPYNEHWTITHECSGCDRLVSFSRSRPVQNVVLIDRLHTRFHHRNLLQILAAAFDPLHVLDHEIEDWVALTPCNFTRTTAPIYEIPLVTFIHYTCDGCAQAFLCRFAEGQPMPPDRGNHTGRQGLLIVREIAAVEVHPDGNVPELVRSYAHLRIDNERAGRRASED